MNKGTNNSKPKPPGTECSNGDNKECPKCKVLLEIYFDDHGRSATMTEICPLCDYKYSYQTYGTEW